MVLNKIDLKLKFSVLLNNEGKFFNVKDLNPIFNGLVKINEFNQRRKCE